jgi:glutamyl-tRNA synthetase
MLNTRIAPSPSGDMHIGTARTAYFNWLAAKASGGKFILRIDDTNQDKIDQKYVDVITETMDWLGLTYDSIHFQSQRFDIYKSAAQSLVDNGKAKVLDNGAIALTEIVMPEFWKDEVAGNVAVSNDDREKVKDLILLRGDGSPTYHFASVFDDADLDVNFILRGVDHISNTARQIAIFNAIGKPVPKFAHVGLIHSDGKKMSKSDGAASMLSYREKGYDPDAMLNFLLRMGWGPRIDDKTTKIINKDRAVEMFLTQGSLRGAPSGMDVMKLDSFDRKYKAIKKA